jgi:NAD(P)-dependent dehydrogenase (short-subunit alcohol dehydrogenase family)
MTMAINHYGHFYLTYLLFDSVKKSKEARIINVASMLHKSAKKENNVSSLIVPQAKDFDGMERYKMSKLANVMFTACLAEKISSKYPHIKTVSLCPGVVDSNFFNIDSFSAKFFRCCCFLCLFQTPDQGSRTTMHVS